MIENFTMILEHLTPETMASMYADLQEHPIAQERGWLDEIEREVDMPAEEFFHLVSKMPTPEERKPELLTNEGKAALEAFEREGGADPA
jgi:hypothetical protein